MTTDIELRKLAEFKLPEPALGRRKDHEYFGQYEYRDGNSDPMFWEHFYTADQMRQAYTQGVASMADRLEKAEKDAGRLRWLDEHAHVATWVVNEPTKLVVYAATGEEFTGNTWSEAIDAAMEATK